MSYKKVECSNLEETTHLSQLFEVREQWKVKLCCRVPVVCYMMSVSLPGKRLQFSTITVQDIVNKIMGEQEILKTRVQTLWDE